jgi:hypothetical protein
MNEIFNILTELLKIRFLLLNDLYDQTANQDVAFELGCLYRVGIIKITWSYCLLKIIFKLVDVTYKHLWQASTFSEGHTKL